MKLSRISELFRPKSALDNADRGLNNCDILRKPNTIISLIIILLFIYKQNKPSRLSLLLSTYRLLKHFANSDGLVGSASFFSLKYSKKACSKRSRSHCQTK